MKKITKIIALIMLSVSINYAQDTEERYTIKNLEVNNELSNFGTTYYGENQIVYASPRKKAMIIKNIWSPNEQPYLDLYIGTVNEDGEIVDSEKINKGVNTRYHEADVTYTNDMQTVYFTRDNYYDKNLNKDGEGMTHLAMYKADVISPSKWENVVAMPFNNKDYSVGHPTLSADNKTLYFVSDIPGSYGQTDIFKVAIHDDGTYGQPVNLGAQVNTSGREMFPFMSDDGFLYFASDRAGGMGNLDIYAVRLDSNSEVQNLGMPINSINDDFAFLKKNGADYGYFSSNRSGGHGDDDIYYFKELEPLEVPCDQVAEGVVTNKETGRRIPGALVLLFDENGKEIDSQIVKEDAKFSFEIDCKSNYKVVGSKETYTEDTKTFTSNTNVELGLNLDLGLGKVVVPVATTPSGLTVDEYDRCQSALSGINNIYFDLNKSFIRPDAAIELDKVVRIMQRCPNITVEASSHTDSRASNAYNESLSQRRAQATVDYITQIGGILGARINAVGYGEMRILNRCTDDVKCSEAEHQINRRTQFDVSNY